MAKRITSLLSLIVFSLFSFVPVLVFAANEVVIEADTTLTLPDDNSNYTLKASSQFDSMDINTTTFSFTLSQGSRVTLVSEDKKKLTNTLNKIITCGTSESSIFLDLDPPFTTTTVTVTPSGTCSPGGGGTGGGGGGTSGGGGGGSAAPSAATVDKVALLKQQIAATQAAIAQKLAGKFQFGVTAPAFGVFAKSLAPGQKDDEVKRLQQLLSQDKEVYPEGLTTGFYGTLTANAVRKFQLKHGIIKNANDSGNGLVGPKTKAKLNELFGQAPAAPATPATPAAPVQAPSAPAASSANQSLISSVKAKIQEIQAKLIQAQIKLIQEKINALKK